MCELDDTGDGKNLGNIHYHQSVLERHSNFVMKFLYFKDLDGVNTLNIIGVDGGKESEVGKGGVDLTEVITYKNLLMVNG